MTPELRSAMARYEEACFAYRRAVLASLGGTPNGLAIRDAIRVVQSAKAELDRLEGPPHGRCLEPRWPPRTAPSELRQGRWGFPRPDPQRA